MMIPEPSKLNWSTVKPTFEEVKGKTVFMAWDFCEGVTDFKSQEISTKADFNSWFDKSHPIRFAILDTTPPDPEPLPLWGNLPKIDELTNQRTVLHVHGADGNELYIVRPTRSEAINAYNKIAEKLNELSL